MSTSPRISVVIPTHRRETRLAFALDALADQTLNPDEYEVIVVRDDDAAPPYASAPDGLTLRALQCPRPGAASKRNDGWRAARAPVVAFCDDDCRPAADWLAGLLDAANSHEEADLVVQGRTEPDPDELHLLYGLARSVRIEALTPWFETCNIAYPRELLERLGGFDEAFGMPPWGEDTDLGPRARRAGAERAFAGDALVWHAVHSRRWTDALREATRRTRTPTVIAAYPSYRRFLRGGIFANEAHLGITCAVGGALLASRLGRAGPAVAATATLPYLRMAAGHFNGPVTLRRLVRFALHLPVAASVDLVETGATVRGAIRQRTLVI